MHRQPMPLAVVLAGLLPWLTVQAAEVELETKEDRIIYSLGLGLGQMAEAYRLDPREMEILIAGLRDHLQGKEPRVADPAKYRAEFGYFRFERQGQAREAERAREAAREQEFLAEAARRPGAQVTVSGLIYLEETPGTGPSPAKDDIVKVHYHGTLSDGSVFDSTRERGEPATFKLSRVIQCWQDGLQRMKVGGRSTLVCPARLAYGEQGAPPRIKPGASLAFEVELLEVVGTRDPG